jgi:hypothetical protein
MGWTNKLLIVFHLEKGRLKINIIVVATYTSAIMWKGE